MELINDFTGWIIRIVDKGGKGIIKTKLEPDDSIENGCVDLKAWLFKNKKIK